MINFANKLELSDKKYHTNGNLKDEEYKKSLFTIKDSMSFGTDPRSMYLYKPDD